MSTFAELVGAQPDGAGVMSFAIGRELHGAFGGAFGGVVAACAVATARGVAAGRLPASIDVRFLRALRAGTVRSRADVVHAGRSLTVVDIDIEATDGTRAARATVSLADPAALHPLDHDAMAADLPGSYDEAKPWPPMPGREIPIITTLAPRILGKAGTGIASALRLPWEPDAATAAEACCFAADLCVGPPVAAACTDGWVPHPNPDLALRFATGAASGAGATVDRDVVGVGTLARISGGVAAVTVEVVTAGCVAAVGVATSLLLATEGTPR